jgi:hypothetical protein
MPSEVRKKKRRRRSGWEGGGSSSNGCSTAAELAARSAPLYKTKGIIKFSVLMAVKAHWSEI